PDDGRADLPLDFVERIDAWQGEKPRKLQSWRGRRALSVYRTGVCRSFLASTRVHLGGSPTCRLLGCARRLASTGSIHVSPPAGHTYPVRCVRQNRFDCSRSKVTWGTQSMSGSGAGRFLVGRPSADAIVLL